MIAIGVVWFIENFGCQAWYPPMPCKIILAIAWIRIGFWAMMDAKRYLLLEQIIQGFSDKKVKKVVDNLKEKV